MLTWVWCAIVDLYVAVFTRVSIIALAFVASWVVDTLAVVTRSTSAVVSWHVTPVTRPAEVTFAGEARGTVGAITVITDANGTVVNLDITEVSGISVEALADKRLALINASS